MTKQEKERIKAALDTAYENTLKEQDVHSERIDAMEKIGNMDYFDVLPSLGWVGIAAQMSEECSPADGQDRKRFLDQDWSEVPSRVRIDRIEDKVIMSGTYFLGRVVEHCYRIKSWAKFLEILGASPEDWFANYLYRFWERHNILSQLADEQEEVGNMEKADRLRVGAAFTLVFFDKIAKNPIKREEFTQEWIEELLGSRL